MTQQLNLLIDQLTRPTKDGGAADNRTAAEVVLEQTEALTTAGLSAQALENFAAQTCLLDLDPIVRPTPTPVNTDDVAPA